MPCNQCKDPARCDRLGLCLEVKLPARGPKECRPGGHCERYARGMGACIAGDCNPPAADPLLCAQHGEQWNSFCPGCGEALMEREDRAAGVMGTPGGKTK